MKLCFLSAWITIKQLVRDKALLLAVLLLPVGLLAGSLLTGGNSPVAVIRAGVVYDPEDPLAAEIYDALPEYPSVVFAPYTPERLNEVEQLVRTGELECAYVLAENLQEIIRGGSMEDGIRLLKSPRTVADALLNEMVFASILRVSSADIAVGLLEDMFPEEEKAYLWDEVLRRMDRFAEETHFMQPENSYWSGTEEPNAQVSSASRPLHGIIAVFLLAMTLFILPRLIAEKNPGLWRRLGVGGLFRYYGGVWGALLLMNVLVGLPALAVLGLTHPQEMAAAGQEVAALLAYSACLAMAALLCAVLLASPDLLFSGSIFILLLTLVLGGVLWDWAEISPVLAGLSRLFPTEHYIAGAGSSAKGGIGILTGAAAVLGIGVSMRFLWYGRHGRF